MSRWGFCLSFIQRRTENQRCFFNPLIFRFCSSLCFSGNATWPSAGEVLWSWVRILAHRRILHKNNSVSLKCVYAMLISNNAFLCVGRVPLQKLYWICSVDIPACIPQNISRTSFDKEKLKVAKVMEIWSMWMLFTFKYWCYRCPEVNSSSR